MSTNSTNATSDNTNCLRKKEAFITDDSFVSNEITCNDIKPIKWKDLPIFTIYSINSIKEINGKFGTSIIINLTDIDDETFDVWASGRVMKAIIKLDLFEQTWYLKSIGKKESQDGQRSFYDFSLSHA